MAEPTSGILELLAAVASGAGAMKLSDFLLGLRKEKREGNNDAVKALRDALAELRTDVDRLREELHDERAARERAEREVRQLLGSLRVMVGAMRAANVPVPDNLPGVE